MAIYRLFLSKNNSRNGEKISREVEHQSLLIHDLLHTEFIVIWMLVLDFYFIRKMFFFIFILSKSMPIADRLFHNKSLFYWLFSGVFLYEINLLFWFLNDSFPFFLIFSCLVWFSKEKFFFSFVCLMKPVRSVF